jgi:hypothetical protein
MAFTQARQMGPIGPHGSSGIDRIDARRAACSRAGRTASVRAATSSSEKIRTDPSCPLRFDSSAALANMARAADFPPRFFAVRAAPWLSTAFWGGPLSSRAVDPNGEKDNQNRADGRHSARCPIGKIAAGYKQNAQQSLTAKSPFRYIRSSLVIGSARMKFALARLPGSP